MRNIKLLAVILILLVAASLLFGCGGAKDEAEKPIKIGAPIPISGPWAADGIVMKNGLTMAVEELNEQGGLFGRQLQLVIFDTEDMTPEKLTSAADRLVMQDQVDVIVTGYATPGASISAFGRYDVPFLHFEGSALDIKMVRDNSNYRNTFMLGDVEEAYGELTFDILNNLPYEYPNNKIVILAGDFEWDKEITGAIKKRAQEMGWEVALNEVFPYGNREWGALLTRIRAIDPAIISISVMDPADAKTFLDQFRMNPTNSLIEVGYVASIPQFAEIVGEAGEGVVGISTNSILPNNKGNGFAANYRERFGEEPGLSILGTVYDGVMLWSEAAKKAGQVDDYTAIAEAIRSNIFEGVNGTYRFDQDQKAPAGDDGLPMHFFQVQGGEMVRLFVGTEQEGDFIVPPWVK